MLVQSSVGAVQRHPQQHVPKSTCAAEGCLGCRIHPLRFHATAAGTERLWVRWKQAPRRVGGAAAAAKAKALGGASGAADSYQGTFVWRIEHFTRLKDLLKKRKITGLCIKSRRFCVGGCTCRLIVYPRGQSQPPRHLSMFLEVSEREGDKDWSAFVSHRLVIVNQRDEQRSLVKESQVRGSALLPLKGKLPGLSSGSCHAAASGPLLDPDV
jgi:hypothetical protein